MLKINRFELRVSFSSELFLRTGAQTMLYLTCTMISYEDLAYYGISRAKDWVSVYCGTSSNETHILFFMYLVYIGMVLGKFE